MKTQSYILSLIFTLIILIAIPISSQADGIIIPEPPICRNCPVPPPPPREVPYLTVESHRVNVTIDRQVATTHVDQIFRNDSQWSLEGTYIFPLPEEAAISEFAMWIEGEKVEGQLFTKEEARRIYDDIVRRRLDPALLEYIGRDLFQASIFPIDPGDSRRVVIEYSQILPIDNGLVQYVYPLSTEKFSAKDLEDVSVNVELKSSEAIKAIYSPSHPVSIDRPGDFSALVGWEERNVRPSTDFALYYTVSEEDLGLNLLSFKNDTADEDGFFTMLIAPAIEINEVIEKDVVLVLDTSGSMEGEKLVQAKNALATILDRLNPGDRFNVVGFSTGVRSFSTQLNNLEAIPEAKQFVQDFRAEGSTDINRALLEAIANLDDDTNRPTIIIFLTDGLPTSGVTEADLILNNINQNANSNVRIFPFGVGDDVDTFLLDLLAREQRGASGYIRPGQQIDEVVSGFYAKVSTPVLADLELTVDGVQIQETYPYPLPDLFAGTQLIVTGQYQEGGPANVTLSGTVNGRTQTFEYNDLSFTRNGGPAFIPRLWATRKIGYLLNQIRLHGENKEAIDQIVSLSIRYGIITPYTSFLVEEPEDALTQSGRDGIADEAFNREMEAPAESSGAGAVEKSVQSEALENADMAAAPSPLSTATYYADNDSGGESNTTSNKVAGPAVTTVADKAFVLRNGIWTDTTFEPDRMETTTIQFGSPEFMDFLAANPNATQFFALAEEVIVVVDGIAYQSIPADASISATQNQSQKQPTPTTSPQGSQTTNNTSTQQANPTATPSKIEPTQPPQSESTTTRTESNSNTAPRSFFGGIAIGFVIFIIIGGALVGAVALTLKK